MSTKIISENRNHPSRSGNDETAKTESTDKQADDKQPEAKSKSSAKDATGKAKTVGHDIEEVAQLMKRILKLSDQADNPGMAYRNLETIHALAEALSEKLGIPPECDHSHNNNNHQRPQNKL